MDITKDSKMYIAINDVKYVFEMCVQCLCNALSLPNFIPCVSLYAYLY